MSLNPVVLFLLFLKASALSFGGLGGLPILRQDLLQQFPGQAAEVDRLLGQALAVGRLSPGPNGLYVVSLGYEMNGTIGAIAGGVALALPPFVVLIIAIAYVRVAHLKRTANALLVLSFALTGLLGFTSWQIMVTSSHDVFEWIAGILGFVVSARFRLNPLVLIASTAVVGVAIYH
ncbi:MAG TPA: chromate transporter [Chloroflexota bacterium]|nr:chromate transporter [Chloroflexota bacterium]